MVSTCQCKGNPPQQRMQSATSVPRSYPVPCFATLPLLHWISEVLCLLLGKRMGNRPRARVLCVTSPTHTHTHTLPLTLAPGSFETFSNDPILADNLAAYATIVRISRHALSESDLWGKVEPLRGGLLFSRQSRESGVDWTISMVWAADKPFPEHK